MTLTQRLIHGLRVTLAGVTCNQGTGLGLGALVGKTAAATPWTLRLFSNNHTPAVGDTEANYTEVTGGGYASISLTAASFTVTAANPSTAAYAIQTYTFTGVIGGSGIVYGYMIYDANGKLLAAELLGAPFTPTNNGDTVKVTPNLSLASA